MIRINLLPDEYRRAERTSPKVFAATLLGVIMVCSSFGWFGFVYLGELGNLEVEENAVREDLANKKKQASYHDGLVKEKGEFERRTNTIQKIAKSRIQWTEIVDQMIDVVNNDGDIDRHLAWFKSLTIKPGDGKKKGPSVTMPGWVQGGDIKKVADFHTDLDQSPFFAMVKTKSAPSGVVEVTRNRLPPEAMRFDLKWTFMGPKEWDKVVSALRKAKKGE